MCPFLPGGLRPHLRDERFGSCTIFPLRQFLRGGFSGLQAFRNVQAPILARPPDCTHRCGAVANRAAGPVTPRNAQDVAMPELRYRYVPESGNWHGETCTHWIVALSAATHPPPSFHIARGTRGRTRKDSPRAGASLAWVLACLRVARCCRGPRGAGHALVDRARTAWPAPAWKGSAPTKMKGSRGYVSDSGLFSLHLATLACPPLSIR